MWAQMDGRSAKLNKEYFRLTVQNIWTALSLNDPQVTTKHCNIRAENVIGLVNTYKSE